MSRARGFQRQDEDLLSWTMESQFRIHASRTDFDPRAGWQRSDDEVWILLQWLAVHEVLRLQFQQRA